MDLKNPAGPYRRPEKYIAEEFRKNVEEIGAFPDLLQSSIANMDEARRGTKTLPGNWTVAQVVNHIADSHMNALIRIKWALTENEPTIKAYNESDWALLPDGTNQDLGPAMDMIRGIHGRFSLLLSRLDASQVERRFFHPEMQRHVAIFEMSALYSWHGRHHLAHIELLKKDRGWN